jgi:hypothetical protein
VSHFAFLLLQAHHLYVPCGTLWLRTVAGSSEHFGTTQRADAGQLEQFSRPQSFSVFKVVETMAGGTGRRLGLLVECVLVRGLIATLGEPAHRGLVRRRDLGGRS